MDLSPVKRLCSQVLLQEILKEIDNISALFVYFQYDKSTVGYKHISQNSPSGAKGHILKGWIWSPGLALPTAAMQLQTFYIVLNHSAIFGHS